MLVIAAAVVGLGLAALAISVDLKRIADAVEAQNRHYGITANKSAESKEVS